MTRGRLAAACLVLAVLAGCGVPVDEAARPLAQDDIPSSIPGRSPSTTAPAAGETGASVELFFVRGTRLVSVDRETSGMPSADDALAALVSGPTPAERSQGVRTALTRPVRITGLASAGVPVVDVAESFSQVAGEEEILALAQLVFTLTALPGVDGVSFALSGRPVEVPTGDGTLERGPLTRADYATVAPVG